MGCFDYKQEKPILSASSIGAHGRLQGSQGTPKIGMSIGASLKGRVPALIQPWGLGSRWFGGTFLINHSSAVHSSSLSLQSGVLSPASELLHLPMACHDLSLALHYQQVDLTSSNIQSDCQVSSLSPLQLSGSLGLSPK